MFVFAGRWFMLENPAKQLPFVLESEIEQLNRGIIRQNVESKVRHQNWKSWNFLMIHDRPCPWNPDPGSLISLRSSECNDSHITMFPKWMWREGILRLMLQQPKISTQLKISRGPASQSELRIRREYDVTHSRFRLATDLVFWERY